MFLMNSRLIFLHNYLQFPPDHEFPIDTFHSLRLKLKSAPSLPWPTAPQSILGSSILASQTCIQLTHVAEPQARSLYSSIPANLSTIHDQFLSINFAIISWAPPGLSTSCKDKNQIIGGIEKQDQPVWLMLDDLWDKELQHWFSWGFRQTFRGENQDKDETVWQWGKSLIWIHKKKKQLSGFDDKRDSREELVDRNNLQTCSGYYLFCLCLYEGSPREILF